MRQVHLFEAADWPAPLNVIGERVTIFGDGDLSKAFEVHIQEGVRGGGPPPHSHPWDEAFYVLDGEVELTIDGDARVLCAGSFVHIPADTTHAYKNVSANGKLLAVVSDPRGGQLFNAYDEHVHVLPDDEQKLIDIGAEYGIDWKNTRSGRMSSRTYDNTKRAEKSRKTRDAIVETMISFMADGEADVSVADLASRSGVSLRTVYQHFPDKKARIEAIDAWINGRIEMGRIYPRSFDDVPDYVERLVSYIVDNETVIRAQMASGLSKDVRSFRKLAHAKQLRAALSEGFDDKRTIDEIVALIISTIRAEAVFDLRDIYKLSVPNIRTRMRRMIELLIVDYKAVQ